LFSAAALAALTLGPKTAGYTRSGTKADLLARYEAQVDTLLAERGWRRVGVLDLVADGYYRAVRYVGGACAGEVRIAIVPLSGEATALVDNMLRDGDRLFFVHDGQASEAPPPRHAYVKDKLGRMFESLGLRIFHRSPYLAVVAPADCRMETAAPWQLLS
jgi:hypothetical protein